MSRVASRIGRLAQDSRGVKLKRLNDGTKLQEFGIKIMYRRNCSAMLMFIMMSWCVRLKHLL